MSAWQKYSDKFDALSQREKVMSLAASMAVIVLVGFTYGVEPLIKSNQSMRKELATLEVQASSLELQKQVYGEALAVDPNQEYEEQLAQLKQRMLVMDTKFEDELGQLVSPSSIPALMTSMLSVSDNLVLDEMQALEPVNIFADKTDMQDIALYQHGVRMRFTGTFADIQSFLAELEESSWQVYWRLMTFDSLEYPEASLTIEFYTLSTEEVFIRV